MRCTVCGGTMVEQTVRFCACDATPPLIIENVPALVCEQCGEKVFSDSTIEGFESIKGSAVPYSHTLAIHVFDFAATRQSSLR